MRIDQPSIFGSIELGHATDTTIARVSPGVISVESVTIPSISSANTLTNKRITPRPFSAATGGVTGLIPEINTYDIFTLTAQATALVINNHSTSTPTDGEKMIIRIKDNGSSQAISYGAEYASRGVTMPTATVISKWLTIGFIWNANASTWDCISLAQEV